jgi:hypothetical protein
MPETNRNCHPAVLFAIRPIDNKAMGQNFVSLHSKILGIIHGSH